MQSGLGWGVLGCLGSRLPILSLLYLHSVQFIIVNILISDISKFSQKIQKSTNLNRCKKYGNKIAEQM